MAPSVTGQRLLPEDVEAVELITVDDCELFWQKLANAALPCWSENWFCEQSLSKEAQFTVYNKRGKREMKSVLRAHQMISVQ